MRALALTAAIAAATIVIAYEARSAERTLQVVTIAGQAEVQTAAGAGPARAALRTQIVPGGAARTLAGRITLRTPSGQAIRVGPSSRVVFLEADAADEPTRMRLDVGSIWVAVMSQSAPGDHLEIQTSAVAVTVKGSGVGITVGPDGAALVRVYHGSAECRGTGPQGRWTRALVQDQELSVTSAGAPAASGKIKRDKPDAWVRWNEEQDGAGGYGGRQPER